MKKPTTVHTNLDDSDIAELFNLQSVSAPEDVQALIVDQAQQQSEKKDPLSNYSSTEEASFDTEHKEHSILNTGWARGVGIAATVLLAVVVAPGLLKQPESSLDRLSSDEMTKAVAESLPPEAMVSQAKSSGTTSASSTPLQAAESALASADAAPTALEHADEGLTKPSTIAATDAQSTSENSALVRSRNNGVADEAVDTVQSIAELTVEAQLQGVSSDSPATFDSQLNSLSAYRESVDTWMKKIETLIADGKQKEARAEYRLFEQQHAVRAKRFKPDFEGHAAGDELPAKVRVKE